MLSKSKFIGWSKQNQVHEGSFDNLVKMDYLELDGLYI